MQVHDERCFRRVIRRTTAGWRAAALRGIAVALWAAAMSNAAQAIPITWTLSGVMFADGGTANGTFVYDADTNLFSNINIVTSTNPPFGTTYGVATGIGNQLFFDTVEGFPLSGTDRLLFDLVSALTNAGGSTSINVGAGMPDAEGTCTNDLCSFINPFRLITAGGVTTRINGVPEPATWGLALLGLIAGTLCRRKAR